MITLWFRLFEMPHLSLWQPLMNQRLWPCGHNLPGHPQFQQNAFQPMCRYPSATHSMSRLRESEHTPLEVGQHGRRCCAGYLGHRFEKIGMLCMIDQVSLPKHVRCEYNEREPCCSYASSNAPISPRRGSMRALCLHLNEATSMFQLSRDPRTFFALDKAIDNLTFAQNVCRGSVNFMVFCANGFSLRECSSPFPSGLFASEQEEQAPPFS